MSQEEASRPRGVLELERSRVAFREHVFTYKEGGGTTHSSALLGWPEHQVVKSLVFVTEASEPIMVLMNGDLKVDLKRLAVAVGASRVRPAPSEEVPGMTGYQVGGVSPFGLSRPIKIYINKAIAELDRILINGGARGHLVEIAVVDLIHVVQGQIVEVDRPKARA